MAAEKTYATRRYYTNADKSKLVEEGSTEAAYLVVGEGGEITDEMVEKYGKAIRGEAREEQAEEPGIVVSGARDSGPAFVKADSVAEEDDDADAKGATRTAAKTAGKTAKK